MPRRKQTVNTSWAGKYSNEASNQRFLSEIEQYDRDILKEISDSEYRTAQNLYDIELTKEDIRHLEEDPEGYFYEKEQAELEKKPKTFANYMKNWWATLGRKINDFQVGEFLGYIDRANQWKSLAESTQEYLDIQDELQNIEGQLNLFRLNTQNQNAPIEVLQKAYGAIEILETQKQQLQNRLKELLPDVDAFKTYIPGSIKGGFYDVVSGNGESGIGSVFSNNGIFGRTGQLHDELGDITRHTTSMFSEDRTRAEQKYMLKRALLEYDNKIQEWQRGVDENVKDRESYDKVDRWFQNRESKSTMDIFDKNTWLYGMPGLIAGSVSGLSKTIPAMITGALTASAIVATGGSAAIAAGILGCIPTLGFEYGAGVGENNSEVAMAYNDRLEDYLKNKLGETGSLYDEIIKEGRRKLNLRDDKKITDEQIFEQYRKGAFTINNAAANKEMLRLAIGIENQFLDDMMATTYGALVLTVLDIIPLGKALSLPKLVKYRALRTAAGREAIRNGEKGALYSIVEKSPQFVRGFEIGALASPISGLLYAPVHAALSPLTSKVGKMASGVIGDIAKTAHIAEQIPERALAKKFMREPTKRYIKDITGRWIASSISESIEEGKQNISSNRYLNGEYNSAKIKSLGETILDDFLAGSKSAGLLLGMPFEGLLSETDRKTLLEMKGGLILGGLQTVVVNTTTSIAPFIREKKAANVVGNAILLDKAAKVDKLKKGKLYANASNSADSYSGILNAFDRLKAMNKTEYDSSGEYGIDPDLIEEEIDTFKKVASMAHDDYSLKLAKALNIDADSKDYDDFVAVKNLALDELKETGEVVEESEKNLNEIWSKMLQKAALRSVNKLGEFIGRESDKKESSETGIDYESEKYGIEEQSIVDHAKTKNIAEYTALLRRKEQLELGIANAEAGNRSEIKKILKSQLSNVTKAIAGMKDVILDYAKDKEDVDINNLESVESKLVIDKLSHDELTEAFRQTMVAGDDYELALNQYQRVVGKSYLNGEEVKPNQKVDWLKEIDNVEFKGGEAKKVIREIRNTINDDNNLASAIDEDFEDRTNNAGEEVISEEQASAVENETPKNDPVEEFKKDVNKDSKVDTPEDVTKASDLQLKEVDNKISEKLVDPTVPEETKLELQVKKEEIKEEKTRRAAEEAIKEEAKQEKKPFNINDIPDDLSDMSTDKLKEYEKNLASMLDDDSLSKDDKKTIANRLAAISRHLIKRSKPVQRHASSPIITSDLQEEEKKSITKKTYEITTGKKIDARNRKLESKRGNRFIIHHELRDGVWISYIWMIKDSNGKYQWQEGENFAFDIPDEYIIDESTMPTDIDIQLGISRLEESYDLSSAKATLVYRSTDGKINRKLITLNNKNKKSNKRLYEKPTMRVVESGPSRILVSKPSEPVSSAQPPVVPPTPPTPPTGPENAPESSPEQQETISKLRKREELSKSYTKEVTPEYYLIEVNGQTIKMPRVHSVMDRYWVGNDEYHAPLLLGNVFDNLARIFFGNRTYLDQYDRDRDDLIDRLFEEEASHKDNPNDPSLNRINKMRFKDLYVSRDAFADTIDALYEIGRLYQRNGWELFTDPIVWYGQFKTGWVAGETDMIAVDRNGDIHIIDFKTAKKYKNGNTDPYGFYDTNFTFKIPEELQNKIDLLTEEDFVAGSRGKGLSKTARQAIKDVRAYFSKKLPETAKKIRLVWDGDKPQLKYMESDYRNKLGRFRNQHLYKEQIKGSKEDEYSDQLTAYKMLIKKNLFNVTDLEILGFKADYNDHEGNLTSINSIDDPIRIKVSDSDEMFNRLNVEGEAPQIISEEPNPVQAAQESNEQELKATDQKLQLETKTKPVPQAPSVQDPVAPQAPQPAQQLPSMQIPVKKIPRPGGNSEYSNLNTVQVDREHPDLAQSAIFDENFANDAVFEVYTETINDRKGNVKSVYVDVHYNKTYKRVYVYDNEKLFAKIEELERNKKPGQKIIATSISRTHGQIKYEGERSLKDAGIIDLPIKDLVFDPSQGRFGVVHNGSIEAYVNNNAKQRSPFYNLSAGSHPNGSLVYMMHLPRKEDGGKDDVVPVLILRKSLAKDADFILDCLKNIDTINTPHTITVNGENVSIGATKRQLLDLLIPYIDDASQSGQMYAILRDKQDPSKFHIVQNKQPLTTVDLKDAKSINAFKAFLGMIRILDRPEISVSRLASDNAHPAFKAINKFIRNNKHGITNVKVSDSLVFDGSDFVDSGVTGLSWYVNSGIITTKYAGLEKPLISINDVGYDKIDPEIIPEPKDPAPSAPKTGNGGIKLNNLFNANWGEKKKGGQPKRKTTADENKPLLTEETIKKHLRPILGDLVDDPGVVKIALHIANDPAFTSAKVVGKASADAITLYGEAFEYVEYHEAFHRIFELFVPERERNSVYERTAKRLGINLNESTKDNNYAGHRQVAEWLADKYMEFRRYNVSTGIGWLDHVINTIIDAVRALFSINNRQLYLLFLDINSGKYANRRTADRKNIDRFNEMFKELNYEIHSTEFDHIANDPMYDILKQSAFYCMLLGQNVDVSGATVQNTQISVDALKRGIDILRDPDHGGLDLLGVDVDPQDKTAAQLAMSELVVKFDAVADDFAAMMANISTDYRKVMQQENREDADAGESQSSYDENFFKWSYEFDKFDKTTSRVKFFFATIPDIQYTDDTKTEFKYATNELGMPQFIPMNYVFNNVLSNLWDVDTVEEVIDRLTSLATQDAMYAYILGNLQNIIANRVNEDGTVNADNEALLAQLMTTIRSNRHTFMLLRSVLNALGRYDIVLQRSDSDYNAREFTSKWSQILSRGGSEVLKLNKYGQLVFNPRNLGAVYTFRQIARLFDLIYEAVSDVNKGVFNIKILSYVFNRYEGFAASSQLENVYFEGDVEQVTDITDQKQCDVLKTAIVDALQQIGINIHRQEFDWMLQLKYGTSDWTAIQSMMQSTDKTDSMTSFRYFLLNITKDGKLNLNQDGLFVDAEGKRRNLDSIYSDMAFVKELGNWKYEYRHMRDQLSILATGGNRFYEISDNDYMSDVLRNVNKRGKWFDDLKKDPYNYFVGNPDNLGTPRVYGSISLKQLTENPDLKLQLKHFIGFKTDKKGDEGQDYFEITRREDYLSKVGIIENGGMVSLTLSDKKKYCYITGVKLPGIDYTQMRLLGDAYVDSNLANLLISVPDGVASAIYNIQLREDVVDQMVSYAMSEYQSILANASKIKDGHRKVANFDTKEQSVKFSSLLGVWETVYDKDGKPTGEQYISFNRSDKSWEENLGIAEAYFFNRTEEEQRALMARILTKQTEKELKTAESLGLIAKVGTDVNEFLNYANVGLNNTVIQAIKRSYLAANPNLADAKAESLAVVMYINDISNKAIMSGQEMERLYSGNPAFYKWTYTDGILTDRTVDELKRLGGLGSTGINNFTELEGIPERYKQGKYRVAEVDNEIVQSPQYDEMKTRMYEGALREAVIKHETLIRKTHETINHTGILLDIRKNTPIEDRDLFIQEESIRYQEVLSAIDKEVCDLIDNKSIEELEKTYDDIAKSARENSDKVSDALSGGIDVADGGAYISDQMCETLLRMEGAYSDEIQEAFKILRGETESDYLSKIEAYQKVLTSVIGNLKYTAFGRRLQNGVSVPYYHKMALFPIFECIATGRMKNIFDKMKEQEIDMLLVNSAVKVGSEGSKPINWSDYRVDDNKFNPDNYVGGKFNQSKPLFKDAFQFNTYDIEFDYLRKQLNTDPHEEDLLRMGTLMQKIVFSNLMKGRTYTRQDGSTITGKDLLDDIMKSSNELSNIGVDKVNNRFFVTNDSGLLLDLNGNVIEDEIEDGRLIPARNSQKRVLDIEKFAKEVTKMMSDRGADSNILKALELVTRGNEKQLKVPLGAISNANWLESVLISELNKEIIDVNTPGAFFILRSIWAMLGTKLYDGKKSIKGDKDARTLYNGEPLKMVNEEGSMDCVLSIDFFKSIIPQIESDEYVTEADPEVESAIKYYEKEFNNPDSSLSKEQINSRLLELYKQKEDYVYQRGPNGSYRIDKYGNPVPKKKMRDMTFEEARDWLIKKGIIGPKAKAGIVAYRIPTQAQSSIHALRCVDVLPVVRDTVILPQEFTKITGSDFDIDKLGLSTLNFKKDGSTIFKEGTAEYYQNKLIKDYITLLIDPKTQHILHRSIDNDTKLLKDVLKEIEHNNPEEEMPYGFYGLSTLTERKNDYITGKIGIGPFALNNNNHILTMLYGVRFKELDGSLMTDLGLTDLSSNESQDGTSIMSWLSALINAHVDIAKDPYISRLNVNSFTYNLVNTLIRTGFGKNTFYFTTLPIMKELADAYIQAGSSYMSDLYKSKYTLQKEAVEKVAEDRFGEETLEGWTFENILNGVQEMEDNAFKKVVNHYIEQLVSDGHLKNSANSKFGEYSAKLENLAGEDVELNGNQIQMLVYLAYVQMNPYALSVSNLVKYSKIDTKKHGKSYIEQQIFEEGYDSLFNNPDGGGLFEEAGLRAMAEQSYIDTKTRNALAMTKAILKGQFLLATNAFDNAIRNILSMIGKPDSKNSDLWDTISKGIMASIKSEFINMYANGLDRGISTYMKDLVSESEEDLEYTQTAGSNRIKVVGNPKYNLKSYIGGKVHVTFSHEDKLYEFDYNVTGFDEETNELIVDKTRKVNNAGKIHISGGKNTIYDRFLNLSVDLKDDVKYKDVFDSSGEFANALLKSLVTGNTFKYTPIVEPNYIIRRELHDTYETLKFIKLFNALDNNGVESNHIIDAWDQLLKDNQHPVLKRFAEDLVVYAFITSGDLGGFTKFFKLVPLSWRIDSGYADFIARKLVEFESEDIGAEQLLDVILNNWFEGQVVPKYQLADENNIPNFITYSGEGSSGVPRSSFPAVLAALKNNNGIYEPFIPADNAPLFIKIPRRKDYSAKDSQRRVTIYKRISYGMHRNQNGEWVHYPVYVKVEPKGNLLRGNYLITEYGREDSTEKEYTPNVLALAALYKLGDFISDNTIQEYSNKWGQSYAQMMEDMNYRDLFEHEYGMDIKKFNKAYALAKSPVAKIVGKQIVVYTSDNDGYHQDELDCTVVNMEKINNGWLMTIDLNGKEYKVKLDENFEVSNLDSKLNEFVVDVDWSNEPISIKEFIEHEDSSTGSLESNRKEMTSQLIRQLQVILDPLGNKVHGLVDMQKYLQEHPDVLNIIQQFIGRKTRTLFEQFLRKTRPDMADAEIQSTLDFLHSLEDNKENTAYIKTAVRWVANRSITLPQDDVKARQAFDLARKKHIDLQKYNTLGELIAAPEMQPKKKEKKVFDPDTAKTFSNKRTITTEGGRVFTVYDVENTEEGQRDVCKALAAHYEMSPWCLSTFTATGEPTESAERYWNKYNSLPRKIAYENGKPVAFNSDDGQKTIYGLHVEDALEGLLVDLTDKDETVKQKFRELIMAGKAQHLTFFTNRIVVAVSPSALDIPTREAWWDMEDVYPQESLSDSIVSEPKAKGVADVAFQAAQEDLETERREHEAELQDIWQQETDQPAVMRDAYGRLMLWAGEDGDLPFFLTPSGEVYGFVSPNGDIYLDETKISPEHPIHEYTHLWDRIVAKKNPKLWKRGVQLMKQTSLWKQIENDPNYGQRWKTLNGMTNSQLEYLIASEVHSRFVGEGGQQLLDNLAKEKSAKGIISKLKQWILDVWKNLKATFSDFSDEEIQKITLKDFNHMTMRDFADSVNFTKVPSLSDGPTVGTASNSLEELQFAINNKYNTIPYYGDQLSKISFIKNKVKPLIKNRDYRISIGKSELYAIMKPRNVIKDYYSFNEVKKVAEDLISQAGGNVLDFNITEARYDLQGIVITGKNSLNISSILITEKDRKEAEEIKKQCKGE